jgi:hypothetical protein
MAWTTTALILVAAALHAGWNTTASAVASRRC